MSGLFGLSDRKKRLTFLICLAAAVECGYSAGAETAGKEAEENSGKRIVVKYDFQEPSVASVDERARLNLPGSSPFVAEGRPIVAFKTARILLPPSGAIAEVDVVGAGRKDIPGSYELELGRPPQPTKPRDMAAASVGPPKFARDKLFPDHLYELASVQKVRGYRVAILRLFPVQYLARTGRISYYRSLTVTLALSSASGEPAKSVEESTFRGYYRDEARAAGMVDNPEMLKAYPPAKQQSREKPSAPKGKSETPLAQKPNSCQYLVITKELYAESFQPLLDWKMQKGLTVKIAVVEEIEDEYEGVDLQEKIRNFITECYKNLGAEYVLLGGDVEVIPHRGTYGEVGGYTDEGIPCDLYYGCLDGNWDGDGDGTYGEAEDGEDGDEIDLVAEVYVGRAPVSSTRQVENFVSKTLQYEMERSPNLSHALWLGEGLDSKTWGSDSKEELVVLLPESFEVIRLYEKDGTFSVGEVTAELNDSPHIVNHLGHSTEVMVLELSRSNVDDLNNQFPFFLYSQGCDAGAFDYEDSIAEHFVKNEHGAFAVVANSRYGWYSPETTLGTSQAFDREFLAAVFTKGITNLGKALQESKEANIGDVLQTGATRWCYFELNLLGDPETPLFTATSRAVLQLDQARYSSKTPIGLKLADMDLNTNPLVTELAVISVRSPEDLETVFATETTSNSGVFAAEIPLSTGSPAFDGMLQVRDGEMVTATYEDADDGTGSSQTVTATAMIDDSPPSISDVQVADVRDTWAVIEWQSDEPATARVDFGVSPPLVSSASSDIITKTHQVVVGGLESETFYHFRAVATDTVGNETVDDNGGDYYSFKTKHQVFVFSDDVEEGSPSASGEWSYEIISGGVRDWAITTDDFRSQTACWHTDDYPYPSANVLDTPLIDLRGMTNAQLSFWHRMLSETDWDGGFVQVQRDGTEDWCLLTQEQMMEGTPFVPLSPGNPSGVVPGWSSDIPWERVTFELSEFVGSKIKIRFRMESDDNTDAGEGDGWYIDDISVVRAMGTVNLDKLFYKMGDIVSITVLDAAANSDSELVETVSVEVSSTAETEPEIITLVETAADSGTFVGEIATAKASVPNDGQIGVKNNSTIIVSYGEAEPATAIADLSSPAITSVQSTQVAESSAIVKWTTDEECRGVVYYGTDAAELNRLAWEATRATVHQLTLSELEPRSTYYFKVECFDRAGNTALDDNDGELYSFLTLGFSQRGLIAEDTVWRYVDGHPYVITGSVYVGTGMDEKPVTLTIEPGVVVQFKTDKRDLFVRGGIVAQGVTFEFDLSSGRSAHIILEERASGVIDHSVISILGSSEELSGGIECYSSNITFTNNIVRNAYYGFHCLSSSPTISGNSFIVCRYGVFCHAAAGRYSSPEIADNIFIGCTYPMFCEPRAYPVVSGNVFQGNKYDGLIHSSITGDTLWQGYDCPQLIISDLTVPTGKTLLITPGARIRFVEAGADLFVVGNLYAEGATIEFVAPAEPPTSLTFSSASSGSIRNCRIIGKAPDGSSVGGIKCQSSSVSITGNVISNTYYGVFCEPSQSPLIANNTIVGCEFGVYGPDASPTLINSILWNNGDDLVGCTGSFLDTGDGDAGEGNFSLDPLFRDAPNGDFRLQPGSPCIDSGTSEMAPLLDADGYVRWDDPNNPNAGGGSMPYFDIGAREFIVDADADGISDEWENETGLNPADPSDADADPDVDGKSNRQEYVSGTDPNDPSSCLRIIGVLATEDETGGIAIEWLTVSGRSYTVFWTSKMSPTRGRSSPAGTQIDAALSDLTMWKPCSELMEGTGNVLHFLDVGGSTGKPPLNDLLGRRFYHVGVW